MTTAGVAAVAGAFGLMLQAVCLLKNVKYAGNYSWATLAAGGECRNVEGKRGHVIYSPPERVTKSGYTKTFLFHHLQSFHIPRNICYYNVYRR